MDKLKMHSPDLSQANIAKIRELFPNCVTEARDDNNKLKLVIDFEQLQQELSDSIVDGAQERYHLKELFPEAKKVFSNPKPVTLLEMLLSFGTSENDICLDLFAGSATMAEALFKLNHQDSGQRKLITIQYPEEIKGDSQDSKLALNFCTQANIKPLVSEISKERVRRASSKYKNLAKDTGFRVLKIDSSNMTDVYYNPDQLDPKDMFAQVENIKADRTDEDLLFQVLLDWDVGLTLPIAKLQLEGKDIFCVNGDANGSNTDLIGCFAKDISNELIKQLAQLKPLRIVFRDDGFANDAVKINVEQIFKQLSPITDVKSI